MRGHCVAAEVKCDADLGPSVCELQEVGGQTRCGRGAHGAGP